MMVRGILAAPCCFLKGQGIRAEETSESESFNPVTDTDITCKEWKWVGQRFLPVAATCCFIPTTWQNPFEWVFTWYLLNIWRIDGQIEWKKECPKCLCPRHFQLLLFVQHVCVRCILQTKWKSQLLEISFHNKQQMKQNEKLERLPGGLEY